MTKQLDDGIDHTFESAGGVRRSVRLSSLSFVLLNVYCVVVHPALENRYQSTMDMHLRGGSSLPGS